jgi:hypothetical protein
MKSRRELILQEIINCDDLDKNRDERRKEVGGHRGHSGPLKSASKGSDLPSRLLRLSYKNNREPKTPQPGLLHPAVSAQLSVTPHCLGIGSTPAQLSRPLMVHHTASAHPVPTNPTHHPIIQLRTLHSTDPGLCRPLLTVSSRPPQTATSPRHQWKLPLMGHILFNKQHSIPPFLQYQLRKETSESE